MGTLSDLPFPVVNSNIPGVSDKIGPIDDDGTMSFNGSVFHLTAEDGDPAFKFREFGAKNSKYQRICRHCKSRHCQHCDGESPSDLNRVANSISPNAVRIRNDVLSMSSGPSITQALGLGPSNKTTTIPPFGVPR